MQDQSSARTYGPNQLEIGASREKDLATDAAPALMSYIDRDLRYRWANKTYERWYGLPLEKIIGHTVPEVVGHDFYEEVRERVEKALAGELVRFETVYPTRDGHFRFLHVTYTPDFDSTGKVAGFCVLGTDISETEQLRKQVADSSERLHQAVSAAKLGTWEMNLPSGQVRWSERFKELFGLKPGEEIELANGFSLLHAEDVSRVREAISKALDPGGNGNHDIEFRTLAGKWLHVSGQTHFCDGQPTRMIGTVEDVTERKQVEKALRESEELTRSIIESSPDCINVMSLDGKVISINETGCKLLELDQVDSCLHRPWPDIWGSDRTIAERAVTEAGAGHTTRFEGFCPTFKGTPRWWEVVVTPVRDSSGQVIRIMAISRDISERHQAEEERQRLTRELQHSNQELSQFAHIAAHDLQSPLRMIRTYTQLLERQLRPHLNDSTKEFVRVVLNGSERMEKLIQSLLEYAQAGESEQPVESIPMAQVVSEALSNLEIAVKETEAEISYSDLPVVRGDEFQLMQVVQNTISNSIKYRRNDVPLKIQIGAERQNGLWQFCVRDNGQGIASQYLEHVFKPFKRLHGQEIAGTGMGLAVCRKIVERHGGKMWAESQEGAGSSFYFTLPVEASEQTTAFGGR